MAWYSTDPSRHLLPIPGMAKAAAETKRRTLSIGERAGVKESVCYSFFRLPSSLMIKEDEASSFACEASEISLLPRKPNVRFAPLSFEEFVLMRKNERNLETTEADRPVFSLKTRFNVPLSDERPLGKVLGKEVLPKFECESLLVEWGTGFTTVPKMCEPNAANVLHVVLDGDTKVRDSLINA